MEDPGGEPGGVVGVKPGGDGIVEDCQRGLAMGIGGSYGTVCASQVLGSPFNISTPLIRGHL